MIIENDPTITQTVLEIALAPYNHPELLPSVLPLILGAFIIELYFGKHKSEVLGWNTSVGNAVIWISTGLSLFINESLKSPLERGVTFFILLMGAVIAYMDFFHKWSAAVAFRASSADVIYPLAYVTVVMVKTPIPVTDSTLKAAVGFVIGSIIFFRILRLFETPAPDDVKHQKH